MTSTRVLTRLGQFLVAVCILTGSHALGQTITQYATFTGLSGATPVNYTFNAFDTSTGDTLTSVQIELVNVTLSGTAQGTNNLPSDSEDIVVNLTGTLTVTASGINVPLVVAGNANEDPNVAAGASTPVYTYTNQPATPSSASQTLNNPPTDLTSYTTASGTTTVTVTVTPKRVGVTGSAFDNNTGNSATATFSGSATVSGTLEIIYTYTTPVPEPAQTAALMMGFAMCVMVGRNYFQGRGLRLT